MVERIDAQGQDFSDVSRKIGTVSRRDYRLMWFGPTRNGSLNSSLIPKTLANLSQYPQHDARSFLVENARDKLGRIKAVLVVPSECPGILLGDSGGSLPNPDETFLVTVQTRLTDTPYNFLVLSDTPEQARGIAELRLVRIKDQPVDSRKTRVNKVTPEEFMEEAKRQIDDGIILSGPVLRFGDLRERQQTRLRNGSHGNQDSRQIA